MISLGFVALRRAIDAMLGFLLIDVIGAAQSPADVFRRFCELPDLSKIGAITVTVVVGSVLLQLVRFLAGAWRARRTRAAQIAR